MENNNGHELNKNGNKRRPPVPSSIQGKTFTKHAKELIKKAFNVEMQHLSRDLNKMTPVQKWQTMVNLLKYVLPTMIESKNKSVGVVQYNISYSDDLQIDFKPLEIGEDDISDTTIDDLLLDE